MQVILDEAIWTRKYWIGKIRTSSENFTLAVETLESELIEEIRNQGSDTLINHLRLCGSIPESYEPDSSAEKIYSKYTDILLSLAYNAIGLSSIVLTERADSADVEVTAENYSFVADAKAFRLSRTAKNQKDFKIQSMDDWKRGKLFAMVVCPIYQLPIRSSQIYQQSSIRNVCIFTYSHLSLLVNYAVQEGQAQAEELLRQIFKIILVSNPSKNALDYWLAVNKTILNYSEILTDLWQMEKKGRSRSYKYCQRRGFTIFGYEAGENNENEPGRGSHGAYQNE